MIPGAEGRTSGAGLPAGVFLNLGAAPQNMGKKLFLKILRVIDNSVENT